jgi:hypothetical protein
MAANRQMIQWQPHITLKGELVSPTVPVTVTQPARDWLQTLGMSSVLIKAQVLEIGANCHLYLESSPTVEGPWFQVADWTAVGEHSKLVSPEMATQLMQRYLRWRFESTLAPGSAWTVCFRLTAMPRQEQSQMVPTVRSRAGAPTVSVRPTGATSGGTQVQSRRR